MWHVILNSINVGNIDEEGGEEKLNLNGIVQQHGRFAYTKLFNENPATAISRAQLKIPTEAVPSEELAILFMSEIEESNSARRLWEETEIVTEMGAEGFERLSTEGLFINSLIYSEVRLVSVSMCLLLLIENSKRSHLIEALESLIRRNGHNVISVSNFIGGRGG